ncbi:TIM23 complex component [Myotisia sp. PD_48]|nr:TIM23 complex component [Myotisia sp. PD_48]
MNVPIRTAAFGSRVSCAWSPLVSSSCPLQQPRRTSSSPAASSHGQATWSSSVAATRPARYSTISSSPKRQTPLTGMSVSRSIPTSTLLSIMRCTSVPCPQPASTRLASSQAASSSGDGRNSENNQESYSNSSPDTPVRLDWNSFFTLRASRRKYSLVSSILASLTTTATGGQILASQNLENLGTQVMGLDPLIVLGLATAASGAAGWLAGPFLGNALWGLVYRKYKAGVAVKEKEFYDRIKRFRVDPSANSFANPVPDYYGEKIGSVQGYRQWLKDQRAYNRKKRNFV